MRISLFTTCLVDQFHPEVAIGMVTVLRRLGIEVDVPRTQTCCGQPAFNSGLPQDARAVGRHLLSVFDRAATVVVPSGSCASMVKSHLPSLFAPGSAEAKDAAALAARTHELAWFLVHVAKVADVGARFPHRVAYHDSCHLLRELGIASEPRTLLAQVRDLELVPLPASDTCCGFGGAFAAKYPDISAAMGGEKLANLERSGAEALVAADTGCLMHLRGLMARRGVRTRALHLAEVLASEG
jgi:L-lactate dehydrogenase complex protein LldE